MRNKSEPFNAYRLVRPLLFSFDAEQAHGMTLKLARYMAASEHNLQFVRWAWGATPRPMLETVLFNRPLKSPIGLAAGLDKNAEAVPFWRELGFGFVEVGTVTPLSQDGNPKPRMYRMPEARAIVNRLGFNNKGVRTLVNNLKNVNRPPGFLVGVSIGKQKETALSDAVNDYSFALEEAAPWADYIAINVSSPNTLGLRQLQAAEVLHKLIVRLQAERHRATPKLLPIVVKLAPDLSDVELDDIVDVAKATRLDGIIATNTTVQPAAIAQRLPFEGGISGRPLKARSLQVLKFLYRRLAGAPIPLVSVGGIETANDVMERIRAGATAVQLYTALIYEGPGLIRRLTEGLEERLTREGYRNVRGAIGVDAG